MVILISQSDDLLLATIVSRVHRIYFSEGASDKAVKATKKAEVDAEAEKLEHHISEDFEERIDKMLNYPSTDPHGDPIPTREGFMPMQLGNPLSDCQAGESVVVRRVRDSDSAVLRFLTKIGICLETQITILERQPFNGPMRIRIGEIDHSIGLELAGHLFVEPVIAGGMH
mgnify:CR=1 FL=1